LPKKIHKEFPNTNYVGIVDFDVMNISSHLQIFFQALKGKAFCSLPLPFESPAALTGLPVHVNASFGLSDNRRDIKWTGNDQKNDFGAR
jgi:hypothetical protein